jgi:hemerythrin-like domain-containing protein
LEFAFPRSSDHQISLHALEVLRLIGDRMERRESIDIEDVRFVFQCLNEVAHHCLDSTEELLLRPALAKPAAATHSDHLGATLINHRQVRTLFGEMVGKVESTNAEEFISLCRAYTGLLTDLIFDENRFLPDLVRSVFTDSEDRQRLEEFEMSGRGIGELARRHGGTLHRLQLKYVSPHCI